ncbi:hypothetical protein CAEBREN_18605 [Caenorhabditis brenneri]|uniref:Uncharacterized protein n=1 Tax=Caenorhabditis brenneri TaxID=135651 RepID=G0NFN4_CAEBE|nr:hypothetical protein CAEBREN_18605 [Caenorhabditis brenneri]
MQYGRFCKTAGKQVLVDFAFGKPQHFDYNHDYHRLEKVDCMECYEEYYDYKWEEPDKDTPDASPAYSVPKHRSTLVVTVDETVPPPVTATDSKSSAVFRASSTESHHEGFDNIDSKIVLTGVLVKKYFIY